MKLIDRLLPELPRPTQLRIGVRLILSFLTIVLLMAAGYGVAFWQFRQLRAEEQNLDKAQQESAEFLNLYAHLYAFRDRLEDAADKHDAASFVREANRLAKSILNDTERAKRTVRGLPSEVERDSFVLVALDTIQISVPVQVAAMADLANVGDWPAIRLRSQNQIKQVIRTASSMVDRVALEVSQQRLRVLKNTQLTERRVRFTLIAAACLTLLVVAALGLTVTRSITRPLYALGRASQALARGDFHYKVTLSGSDELTDLANVFNQTAGRLHKLYDDLQRNEARFRALIEHSSDFIIVLDREERIHYISPSGERALGIPWQDLVGRPIFNFMHPDDVGSARLVLGEQAPDAIRTFVFRYLKPQGGERIIEAVVTNLLGEPAVAGLVVNARDISDRRRAEEELSRSEAFLAEGEKLSHTGSWAWNLTTGEVTWSLEHFIIMGYPRCQPTLDMFFDRICTEDNARVRTAMRRAVRGKGPLEIEFRINLPDGSVRYIAAAGHTLSDEAGQPIELICTSMDVTERKRAEDALQQAQAELAHVARVAGMGELTASIAHEVSQPLTGIIVNATAALRWLSLRPPNLEKAFETVTRITRDGERAAGVVARLRAFFRKSLPKIEPLNINEAILDVAALIGSEVRAKDVALDIRLADELPPVAGDRIQLQQLILNLMVNAIEAMSKSEGERTLQVGSMADPAGNVVVSVRDSGPGLDSVNLDRLFDAFYTTKSEGMGMGLAICRSIVEAHGGQLCALANHGRGATFEFTLPTTAGKGDIEQSESAAEVPVNGSHGGHNDMRTVG